MNIRQEIKSLLAQEDWTMARIMREMDRIKGKEQSKSNLSQQLKTESLKYKDAKLIAEILGYELKFVKKK